MLAFSESICLLYKLQEIIARHTCVCANSEDLLGIHFASALWAVLVPWSLTCPPPSIGTPVRTRVDIGTRRLREVHLTPGGPHSEQVCGVYEFESATIVLF